MRTPYERLAVEIMDGAEEMYLKLHGRAYKILLPLHTTHNRIFAREKTLTPFNLFGREGILRWAGINVSL